MIKKILVSILTIALIASVCAIVPVMASGEESAQMDFATYVWGNESINVTTFDGAGDNSAKNPNTTEYVSYGKNSEGKVAWWETGSTGNYIIVELPQKVGYDLKAVAVSTVYYKNVSTNNRCFDYSYATETGGNYTVLTNAYISTSLDTLTNNYKAYVDIVSVPADAKYLKIARNNTDYTGGSYEDKSGVLGFTMGYAPQNVDEMQLSTDCVGPNLMNLLASGLLPASGEISIAVTQDDKLYDSKWGLTVAAGKTLTFSAFEGYKVTDVSLNYYPSSAATVPFTAKLGAEEKEITSIEGVLKEITLSSASGEDSFSLTSGYGTGSAYDINITIKKFVPALGMEISSAAVDGENMNVTVIVSNRSAAMDDEMKLLVAGYEGTEMAGVYIIPVKKTDQDDVYTAVLPKSTTTIRAFLWKDLQTLVPVLPSTPEFKVAQ